MQKPLSNSAGAIYLDRGVRLRELRAAARQAALSVPAIRRVILFGSLANGIPTPRSDADLFIEVSSSQHASAPDRVPEMLRALSPLPCPVDLFIATTREAEEARRSGLALMTLIETTGVDLLAS